MGEEKLNALLQESLATATRTGAAKPADFTQAIVDTTVQPKAVTYPTDAKLMHRARERLVRLAKTLGVDLRQSYARVGKIALIQQQRYAHAKQFNRAKRALRQLKTYLGRIMRDIGRRIRGEPDLEAAFAHELMLAGRVHRQNKNLRPLRGQPAGMDLRVFSLHAPEVECIGKGKAHKPYEFGVKVSVATTLKRSKGGQFVTHVQARRASRMTATRWRPSSRPSRRRSAPRSRASSPMPATRGTRPPKRTASGSTPQARSAA